MQKFRPISIIICTLVCLASFNCSHPVDCSAVKNGKFFYYAKTDGRKVLIERKDSVQIETDQSSGKVEKSKIIWENDCTFKMYIDPPLGPKPPLIEIISVNKDFYTC